MDAYRKLPPDDSGGFARDAPAPPPPLPLKFTCAKCLAEVPENVSRCTSCGAKFYNAGGTDK